MVQDERPISQRCGKFQKLSLHPIPNSYSCFRRSEHSKYNKKKKGRVLYQRTEFTR